MCIQGNVDWSNSVAINHRWNFAITAKATGCALTEIGTGFCD
jgi:hypothetical protein